MSNVDTIKDWVAKLAKPLIVKYITRFITWGTTTALVTNLFGKLEAGTATGLAEWLAAGTMTAITLGIDYLYNRGNKKTETALNTVVAGIEEAKIDNPKAARTVTDAIGDMAVAAGTTDTTKAAVSAAIKANRP